LLGLYGQSFRYVLPYILPVALQTFSAIGYTGLTLGIKRLSRWVRLLLYDRFGYVEMTRFLMKKILLFCRLLTAQWLCFVHGRYSNFWRIATFLIDLSHFKTSVRRCLYDWRTRRRSLFPNMGGSIINVLWLVRLCRII
jgi:hypothetical protein